MNELCGESGCIAEDQPALALRMLRVSGFGLDWNPSHAVKGALQMILRCRAFCAVQCLHLEAFDDNGYLPRGIAKENAPFSAGRILLVQMRPCHHAARGCFCMTIRSIPVGRYVFDSPLAGSRKGSVATST